MNYIKLSRKQAFNKYNKGAKIALIACSGKDFIIVKRDFNITVNNFSKKTGGNFNIYTYA